MRKRFKRDLPELDPETDMSITDTDYRKAQRKSETLEGLLKKHPLAASPTLQERLTQLRHKQVCFCSQQYQCTMLQLECLQIYYHNLTRLLSKLSIERISEGTRLIHVFALHSDGNLDINH